MEPAYRVTDSRPVYAAVGGFKKECACKTPEKCTCKPRFSDADTQVGRQRIKVNQNKFFIGYRKNTVICDSSQGPMPLGSVVVHAKTSDSNMLPSLKRMKDLDIQLPNMVADMGYIPPTLRSAFSIILLHFSNCF